MNPSSIVCIWLMRSFSIRSFSGSALPILTFLPSYFALTFCFDTSSPSALTFLTALPLQLACVVMHHHIHFVTFVTSLPSSSISTLHLAPGSSIPSRTYNLRNKSKLQCHILPRANIIYEWSTLHA